MQLNYLYMKCRIKMSALVCHQAGTPPRRPLCLGRRVLRSVSLLHLPLLRDTTPAGDHPGPGNLFLLFLTLWWFVNSFNAINYSKKRGVEALQGLFCSSVFWISNLSESGLFAHLFF